MVKLITKVLSKNNLNRYLKEIISIDRFQMREFEKWGKDNFLLDLHLKFDLSLCIVANNKLIGYCIVSKKGKVAHIHRIAVSPKHSGKCIGHIMIEFLKQKAKKYNCQKIVAETLRNIKSNKFYRKEGFRQLNLAEQKNYSLKKEPEIRQKFMKKSCVFELKI